MPEFSRLLASGKTIIFDGAMGTLLQDKGLAPGESPEAFGLGNPEALAEVHREYMRAGAMVVITNTFGGTGAKLPSELDPLECNRSLARTAKSAVEDKAFVAGSVGPTGKFVRPLGDLSFRELVELFKRQIRGLAEGGADLILGETHFDLAEARAVVVASREVCDLPVGISMTFEEGVSLTGARPLTFIDAVQNMGVELLASNCSAGPEGLREVVGDMLPRLSTPLLVQPNAGLPELVDGKTVFRLGPEDFAEQTAAFLDLGVRCLGGCCGTTPEHIRALSETVEGRAACETERPAPELVLTSRSVSVPVGFSRPCTIIGERINPTGKKLLAEELARGAFGEAMRLAEEQIEAGARVLDVNVGAAMVREAETLPALVQKLVSAHTVPLCIDSSDPAAVRAALDAYPGSPLVNSVSGEPGKMEELAPLCKLYGAPFILLPIKGRKLPVSAPERIAVIEELLAQADEIGVPRRLVLVDVLALTVSSKPEAASAALEVIRHCKESLGLPTVIGLSNISFGLPARDLINSAFLSMCMGHGLTSYIGNPGSASLREAAAASEVLLGRDENAENFIAAFQDWSPGSGGGATAGTEKPSKKVASLKEAVVRGARDDVLRLTEEALDAGRSPADLVDEELIPGITEVGDKYEKREYFLPQLLLSAETMQRAFERLRPLLEEDARGEKRGMVVIATVEGDIHDIGKNIVILMLRNHGFEVLDLGKDVSAATIVEAAEKAGADIIALSALMTTTMVKMGETVELARETGLGAKVIVGGAVVSDDYADSIGADGYAPDAVGAVRLAEKLMKSEVGAR